MPQRIVPGGWDKPEVATAQHALVVKELIIDAQAPVGPYAAFRWAMDTIGREYGSLLDVGCGCGHYGVLCERFYPNIHYHGTDISEIAMTYARGLAPLGFFAARPFEANHFEDYDIILASQVLEMLDDPPAMLDLLLSRAREYVILNRIRITDGPSHGITEGTYCLEIGRNYLWNLADLTRRIEARAAIVARHDWDGQCTFVVRVEHDKSTKLCGCACNCA